MHLAVLGSRGLVILGDFSNLNDCVVRSGQWGAAQHIWLAVVWLVVMAMGQSPACGPTPGRWEWGQAGGAGTCPGQSRAPVVARLRGWICKQPGVGTEGGEGPSVPCDSSAHLLKSKWMDAKPWGGSQRSAYCVDTNVKMRQLLMDCSSYEVFSALLSPPSSLFSC